MLGKVDPNCDVFQNEKGEFILEAIGEIHLERCIKDLETDYFCQKVKVSDLLVDFRETVI